MATISLTVPEDSGFTHILFNLAAQGVAAIKIEYSGYGDSGGIDGILLHNQSNVILPESDDDQIEIKDPYTYDDPDNALAIVIERKVFTDLLSKASDWYNNDGGGGSLIISTHDGTYHWNHYVNVTHQEYENYDGKFGD